MSAAKQRGTAWESAIVTYLKTKGHPHVERRALNGAKDRGDIAGIPGVVIEAKSAKAILLGPWLDETECERDNDHASYGALWIKRRGHTNPGRAFVVMSGDDFVKLLADAGHGDGIDPWIPDEVTAAAPQSQEFCPDTCTMPDGHRHVRQTLRTTQ